ncbi:MAG: calcium/sodium antiporter [Balneolaceae bacterium]
MIVIFFIVGLAALITGAELFLKGVDRFGTKWRISSVVMGLTVVAFATGAPELAVSLKAAASGSADLVLGNIIGSNIANILLILGISAMIKPISISLRIVRFDVPVVIIASVLLFILALDGELSALDGAILFSGLIFYSLLTFFQIRRESRNNGLVDENIDEEIAKLSTGWFFYFKNIGFLIVGLALIVQGANWMVESAVEMARILGVSELIIGLTIVSIGTSLPEVATSIAAIRKGDVDMAVANVMGSNLYNIFLTMGLTLLITPNILAVSAQAIHFDLPFMIAISIACIPIFIADFNITKSDGFLFLFYYVGYIFYLILDAINSPFKYSMELAMIWVIIPGTLLYMAVRLFSYFKKRKATSTI